MKNRLMIIVGVLVLVGAGIFFYVSRAGNVTPSGTGEATTTPKAVTASSTVTDGTVPVLDIGASGDYTIEALPIYDLEIPPLRRPFSMPESFDTEAGNVVKQRIAGLIEVIEKNKNDSEAWLSLAIYRKVVHDYEGARDIWEYLDKTGVEDVRVFSNLGEIYHLYLKDFPKSESNYRKSIEISPSIVATYHALHDLYKYSYKQDTTAAADILKAGLSKSPESLELLVTLARYYAEKKNVGEARIYFEKSIAEAKKSGTPLTVEQLEKELAKLE